MGHTVSLATFVAAALAALVGCATTPMNASSPAARFKAPLLPFVVGTYGTHCETIDETGATEGGPPMTVDASGRMTKGGRSDDVLHEPSEISLLLDRGENKLIFDAYMLGTPVDGKYPWTGNAYSVSYGYSYEGRHTAVDASGSKPMPYDLCFDDKVLPGMTRDLWPVAASFIAVDRTHVACVDGHGGSRDVHVAFSATSFTIDDHTVQASAQRAKESIYASDEDGGYLVYGVEDVAGVSAWIRIRADDGFVGVALYGPKNSLMLSCGMT